jgi:hypothetical protein
MRSSSKRQLAVGVVLGSVVLAGLGAALPAGAAAPAAVPTTDHFSAVTPTRILDTRNGTGLPGGHAASVGKGGVVTLHVAGVAGVPNGADAVTMNVTAVKPDHSTFITVYAGDLAQPPTASNLNAGVGQIVPNLVTVRVDAAGDVKLANAFGNVNLVADVTGYYGPSAPDTYTPLATPTRLLDTRTPPPGGFLGPVGPGESFDVAINNQAGMPANVDAVVLNVTAVGASASTVIAAYPTPAGADVPPTVSNLNVLPGHTVANLVTVGVGAGGKVRLRNSFGNVQLVADVEGYFSTDPAGSLFTPVDATRLLDTRGNAPTLTKEATGPGGVLDLTVTGNQGMPADAVAALFNLTAVSPTASTFVQAYPSPASGNPIPLTSNINLLPGDIRANLAVVGIGAGGDVRLRNHVGTTNLVVDLAGYYTGTSVDHGSAPTGAPGFAGLVINAAFVNAHPGQYGNVSLNVTTNVDTNPFTAAAHFAFGTVQNPAQTLAGTPLTMTFGVKNAPIGVLVPVVLTATDSAYLQTVATSTVAFEPVATTCRTAASPSNPQQHTDLDIIVVTVPGAKISVLYHFKAGAATQASHADSSGRADVLRNIGGATVGYAVPVTVTVTLGPKSSTCSTTFTPRA